jgi:hypothetical protein
LQLSRRDESNDRLPMPGNHHCRPRLDLADAIREVRLDVSDR